MIVSIKLKRAARVILIGAPGVGKGTQSERLLKRYPQMAAISSGELLRNNVTNRTPLGIMAEARMKAGNLVPDNMMLRLIVSELTARGWLSSGPVLPYTLAASSVTDPVTSSGSDSFMEAVPLPHHYSYSESPAASFILDGFPRNAAQASQIEGIVPINFVVNLKTPTDILIDRICNRWIHAPSGRVYNTTFNPPKNAGQDDITGEPLTKRSDDDPEVWKNRLVQFEEASLPLLEHYDKKGILWNVSGNSSDEISPKLYAEFERRFTS